MDDGLLIGLGGLGAMIALALLRMPIGYAMCLVGGIGIAALAGVETLLAQLKDIAFAQFSIYDLSVIPLFVLMGALATRVGLSAALFRASAAMLGRFRGGVAMSAVAACAGFGAVCGSSLATASTMAQVALPELRRRGYADDLATGALAAGGVLGILIPPSVVLVLYAILVEANIAEMFMAALIPGLLALALFLLTIAFVARLRPGSAPPGAPPPPGELAAALAGLAPVAVIFGLVIGGLYAGWFTPTPAAAIGVLLTLIYGLIRRALGLAALKDALLETAKIAGMLYLILLGAALISIFLARAGAPQAAAAAISASGLDPWTVLILILLALIILGCVMDSLSMILLAVPFLWPVIAPMEFGLGAEELKIWFGILLLIVVELGLITPPIGLNVFAISAQAPETPLRRIFIGVAPFFAAELVRVALILALPGLALALPLLLGV